MLSIKYAVIKARFGVNVVGYRPVTVIKRVNKIIDIDCLVYFRAESEKFSPFFSQRNFEFSYITIIAVYGYKAVTICTDNFASVGGKIL